MEIEKPIAVDFMELAAAKQTAEKVRVNSKVGFAPRGNPHIESLM
jgi:predicted dehydrogenase